MIYAAIGVYLYLYVFALTMTVVHAIERRRAAAEENRTREALLDELRAVELESLEATRRLIAAQRESQQLDTLWMAWHGGAYSANRPIDVGSIRLPAGGSAVRRNLPPARPTAPPKRDRITRSYVHVTGVRPRDARGRFVPTIVHNLACSSLLPSAKACGWPCDCGAEDPREFPIPGETFRGEKHRRD